MIILAQIVFESILTLLLCFIVHEGSHYIASILCGEVITFEFQLGYLFNIIPIPRYIWYMPFKFDRTRRVIVASAGFGVELILGLVMYFIIQNSFTITYLVISILHILLYKFYAGDNSDFNFLR